MHITRQQTVNSWTRFTLVNDHGMKVSVLNFGGIIHQIMVPDKNGKMENVVSGYENIADYAENPNYFGALIGRVAGRIANSSFKLDGKIYTLDNNEGKHHLHGGASCFSKALWKGETFSTGDAVGVKLTHTSSDGVSGYPGTVTAVVTYSLTNSNELIIDYQAQTDQPTVLSMTNHSYFNLSGNLKSTIHDHHVQVQSDHILSLDEELIPTGELLPVADTPFDMRNGRMLADGIYSHHVQNQLAGDGYDHYFLFKENAAEPVKVREKASGRTLTIITDQPGMVMYTGNGLEEGLPLTEGASQKYHGVCFETQAPPASLEHEGLPGIRLEPEETYRKRTIFRFGVE